MVREREGNDKKLANGNGNGDSYVTRWVMGILTMLALTAATFANGAFWKISSDVQENTRLSVRNEERFLAMRGDLAEIKDHLRTLTRNLP